MRSCTLLLAASLLLGASIPSSAAASASYERALELERDGRLTDAAHVLARADLSGSEAAHAARLSTALKTFGAASVYARAGATARARELLAELLPKLDPVRDVFVAEAVYRRLSALGRSAEAEAVALARATLERARQLRREGRTDAAATALASLTALPKGDVPATLLREIRLERARVLTQAAEERESLWDRVTAAFDDVVGPVVTWTMYGLMIAAAIALVACAAAASRRLRRPKARTAIAIEAQGAPRDERLTRNRAATRELATAIVEASNRPDGPSGTEIDETKDLDGSALVNLGVVGDDVAALDSLFQDETPIRVGPLAFSPRQVIALVAGSFRPPSQQELRGWLSADDASATVAVDLFEPRKRASAALRWSASAEGDGARRTAISMVATRIAMQLGGSHVSSSWRSYRDYLAALRTLAAAETPEQAETALVEAQRQLQLSLDHDAANLLARFNLATVLRKRGKNEEAAEQYAYVKRLATDVGSLPEPARSFVGRHPELILVAQYNRACALSKIESWDAHNQAVELLKGLREGGAAMDALEESARFRLTMLSRSALAAALVFPLAHQSASKHGDVQRRQQFHRQVLKEIKDERDWVKALPAESTQLDWQAYAQSLATAHNAYGRGSFEMGDYGEAMRECQRALALRPDFGDAYVTLAAILYKQRRRFPNWQRRAEEYVDRALAISPIDERALFLKGDLASDPVVRKPAEAKEAYARIVDNPWAYFRHAELLEQEGDLAGAAEQLIRSLYLSETPDIRGRRLLELVVKLAKRDGADDRLREEAHRVAKLLQKAKSDTVRNRAGALIEELDATGKRRSRVRRPPTDAAPQTG